MNTKSSIQETDSKMLKLILEASGEGIIGINTSGTPTFVNPIAIQLLGYTVEELLDRDSHTTFHHHQDGTPYPIEECPIHNTILTGNPFRGEDYFKKKDGTFFPVEFSSLPIIDDQIITGAVVTFHDISGRKQAEESLKQSEERYKSLFHYNHSVILLIDPETGSIMDANSAAIRFYGWSLDELCRKNISDINTLSPEEVRLEMKKAKSEERKHFLFKHRKANGDVHDVEVYSGPISFGNSVLLYSLVHDITQRKLAENEIFQLNQTLEQKVEERTQQWETTLDRFHKISDRVPGMVYQFRMNPDGTSCFPYASEGIRDIYRVSPSDVVHDASCVYNCLHPEDFDRVLDSIQQSASKLELWRHNYRVKYPDGTVRWLSGNAMPQKEPDGSFLWHGFISDITVQQQSEVDLAIEKQRLASIIEGTNIGTWEWNIQTGETIFNERWAGILGYTLDEISPVSIETWMKFAHPDDLVKSGELLEKHFQGELSYYEFESRMRHKNNDWIWVLDRGKVHAWDKDGKPLLMSGTHKDITERKRTEAEYVKARNEAEKANSAKSEFLSRMSHELRTPLNSILGFAQLLDMGQLNSLQKKGVTHILNSGKHLLSLINEVLDISSIESGVLSLLLKPIHTESVIKDLIDSLQQYADQRRITIRLLDSPINKTYIKADNLRIRQVVLNLLNNAIKYNKTDGFVTISTSIIPKNRLDVIMLRISITDSGPGISPEDISKLFKSFERLGAHKTETEGTGLGLTVVKKLTEAMGGNVGVDSMPDQGSTFWIEVPVAEDQTGEVDYTGFISQPAAMETRQKGTILYIEDDRNNIDLVDQILFTNRPSIRLIADTNGRHALDLAMNYVPNLILLDLDLPDVLGYDVLTILLTNDKTKQIPVVIISADAMPVQIERLMTAGAKGYLTKPMDILMFLNMVDDWIINKMQ